MKLLVTIENYNRKIIYLLQMLQSFYNMIKDQKIIN